MPLPSPSEIIKCEDIASCFQAIYNFFFAILIALAFLNFLYGAFLYLLSGGGISQKEEGKKKMTNSIISVIVVMIIPIILNMVNPGIFNVELEIPVVQILKFPSYSYSFEPGKLPGTDITVPPGQIEGNPICLPPSEGPCSPTFLSNYNMSIYDNYTLQIFSLICLNESGGNINSESMVDKCQDGNPFSIGLFQINMVASWYETKDGTQCQPDLIFSDYQYDVYNCKVKNKSLYEKCKNALKDPIINVDVAKRKYQSSGFNAWGVWPIIKNQCGL